MPSALHSQIIPCSLVYQDTHTLIHVSDIDTDTDTPCTTHKLTHTHTHTISLSLTHTHNLSHSLSHTHTISISGVAMEACEFWSALSDDNDAHVVLQSHLSTLIPSLISRLQLKEEQILQVWYYTQLYCTSIALFCVTVYESTIDLNLYSGQYYPIRKYSNVFSIDFLAYLAHFPTTYLLFPLIYFFLLFYFRRESKKRHTPVGRKKLTLSQFIEGV